MERTAAPEITPPRTLRPSCAGPAVRCRRQTSCCERASALLVEPGAHVGAGRMPTVRRCGWQECALRGAARRERSGTNHAHSMARPRQNRESSRGARVGIVQAHVAVCILAPWSACEGDPRERSAVMARTCRQFHDLSSWRNGWVFFARAQRLPDFNQRLARLRNAAPRRRRPKKGPTRLAPRI